MSKKPTRNLIWEHIQAIRTCMMVTHDVDAVRARPMRGIPRPEQNAIWIFADRDSHTDVEVRRNPDACLTFTDMKESVFVSLSGRVERVETRETINDLWDDDAGAYFRGGPDDPRVVLLRFEPNTGEYWTAPSHPLVLAIKFLEAKIFGERPDLGSSGRTPLP